jgi:hypothetical protein
MNFSDFKVEEHLTPQQLEHRWSTTINPVSIVTLSRWRRLKKGPSYVKIGGAGHVYYPISEIEAYEDSIITIVTPKDQ